MQRKEGRNVIGKVGEGHGVVIYDKEKAEARYDSRDTIR